MRSAAFTMLALALFAVLSGAAFAWSGAFDVSADVPHSGLVFAALEYARIRSIKMHAAGLQPPAGWDSQPGVVMAVGHYTQHCAVCHGAPGAKQGPIGEGMYPRPPSLTNVSQRYTPGELFWILKHGIKMSGMPSMADDGDGVLWSTVALLEKLPTLSDDDYNDLWLGSQAAGDGDRGRMDMGEMRMGAPAPASPTSTERNRQ